MDIAASLSSYRLVMMCRVSGSGKTTVARLLEPCGFVHLSLDRMIWDKYGDAFAALPFERQKPVFESVFDELVDTVCGLLRAGCKVVVDATMCKRAKRDRLRRAVARFGVVPVVAYTSAPLEVLSRRLAARTGTGPDDQIVNEDQLAGFFTNFERPGVDEECIEISTDYREFGTNL